MSARLETIPKLFPYLIVCLLVFIPAVASGQSFNFANPVVLSPTETPGAWYTDRYAPCGFSSPATAPDGRANALQESICATDFQTPTPSFYNTQGRDFDLSPRVASVSIYLYVPAAWATLNGRAAGFWATAVDSTGIVTGSGDYPIIEFQGPTTSDAGGPSYQGPNAGAGFYGWNNVTGKFVLIGLPAGFTYNSWVKLTITLIPGTGFVYTVTDPVGGTSVSLSSPFGDTGDLLLAAVILQGYNYDSNYSIFWDGSWQATADGAFQVSYAANPSAGESYINIINTGANGAPLKGPGFGAAVGNICVNVYAFAPDEQEISCCSCLLTPNSVANLGVNRDLTSTTLTGVVPTSVVIKLVATLAGTGGSGSSCSNSAATVVTTNIVSGLVAYGTTPQPVGTSYSSVEHTFVPSTLSANELASITGRCQAILGNGSGFGVCNSCRAGALGAEKQ
jgi:hypothetical protein